MTLQEYMDEMCGLHEVQTVKSLQAVPTAMLSASMMAVSSGA